MGEVICRRSVREYCAGEDSVEGDGNGELEFCVCRGGMKAKGGS